MVVTQNLKVHGWHKSQNTRRLIYGNGLVLFCLRGIWAYYVGKLGFELPMLVI